jgi:1,4-dihydroxy-2-naphthoyl-CoA hydrolase
MTNPDAGGSAQPQITQQQLVYLVPFAGIVGAELMSATPEEEKGRLEWSEERCTAGGVLHAGRSTIVVQTDLFDAEGRRVAQMTQTQAVISG